MPEHLLHIVESTTLGADLIMATHNAEAHQAVLAWEQQHPREPEVGAFVSWEELHLSMSDTSIHWEMEKLHDRVLPLRRKFPG
jgi:hypothetical protein